MSSAANNSALGVNTASDVTSLSDKATGPLISNVYFRRGTVHISIGRSHLGVCAKSQISVG